jgi:assimilatory nitrate reductase electron transfer subunit
MNLPTDTPPCGGDCRTCSAIGSCPDRVVCRCLGVTEQTVVSAIVHLGVRTVKELRGATGAGTGCRCCHRELQGYLTVYSSSPADICSAR